MKHQDEQLKLWIKIRKGNQFAFDKLYKFHVQMLFNYGIKLSNDRQLIQDCIQELFINLWKNKENLNLNHSVKQYLFISLRHLIIRKQQKINPISSTENFEQLGLSVITPDVENLTFKNKKIQTVKAAIQHLPKRQKEAIFLKYFESLSYDEIASVMDIQISAVYKLVSQAIKNLKTKLS
ncbi:MAG TPA: sigma-70 family RNA polymerase sigma factor [Candidatus Moranbacteria bacterium]|nr:sigma-70 family RNA polymerase sigma factor [Candidatus Moranbacteria bacterium]